MTLDELCVHTEELAKKLGINNKQLGILLPSMSASQIGRMINKHKVDPKFDECVTFGIEILEFLDGRALLPVAPKSQYPAIFQLAADFLLIERKYRYSLEEFRNEPSLAEAFDGEDELNFENDPDISTFKSVSHLAANAD
jgi:hypothetical protein